MVNDYIFNGIMGTLGVLLVIMIINHVRDYRMTKARIEILATKEIMTPEERAELSDLMKKLMPDKKDR
jgi:hypothetical protein